MKLYAVIQPRAKRQQLQSRTAQIAEQLAQDDMQQENTADDKLGWREADAESAKAEPGSDG